MKNAARVIWIHAASVGETRSVAGLVREITRKTEAQVLITNSSKRALLAEIPILSGTVRMAAPREFAVDAFIKRYRPLVGIFVESEIWPMLIWRSHALGIPLILINARLSDRSFRRWNFNFWTRITCRFLLSRFQFIHAQTGADAQRIKTLLRDAGREIPIGNLKAIPLPSEMAGMEAMANAELEAFLATCKPGWAAISLHEGETEVLLAAQERIARSRPDQVLLIVPRHPSKRQKEDAPVVIKRLAHNAYELHAYGIVNQVCHWVSLGPTRFVFVGGSLPESAHHGGHNILEPIHHGCLAGHGKHMGAFEDFIQEQVNPNWHKELNNAEEIASQVLSMQAAGLETSPPRDATPLAIASMERIQQVVESIASSPTHQQKIV